MFEKNVLGGCATSGEREGRRRKEVKSPDPCATQTDKPRLRRGMKMPDERRRAQAASMNVTRRLCGPPRTRLRPSWRSFG